MSHRGLSDAGSSPDLVGQHLAHFHVVAKLGEGGMGVIYRAIDEKLGRTVALKVLHERISSDDDARRRLMREARAAAALTHPNIATVYEAGEDGGRMFVAMEHVEGRILSSMLRGGPLSVADALHVARGILRGIGKAHEKSILHRDLKPDNVMLNDENEVKVLDFGVAKFREVDDESARPSVKVRAAQSSTDTLVGDIIGTPGYMAPEQAEGLPVDPRADIFSFGVVLYEMLVGRLPFEGETSLELLYAVTEHAVPLACDVNPDVPPRVALIVDRCLARTPEHRFATAREVLAALEWLQTSDARTSTPSLRELPPIAKDADGVAGPRPRRDALGRRVGVAVASLMALVAGASGLGYALRTAVPPPLSLSSTASRQATTLLTFPAPRTTVPEAASEYAAGMQALHDNSYGLASGHFARATALDPSMAAAHLRASITSYEPIGVRTEFEKAVALRAQLSPRDRAFMEAIEPYLQRVPHDAVEAVARLGRALEQFPDDAEMLAWQAYLGLGHPEASLAAAERAIEIDPEDGGAWQSRGYALALLGREDEARVAFERCSALAVDSSDCLMSLAFMDSSQGRCDVMEADARRLRDRDPSLGFFLAEAMEARGAPEAAVRQAAEEATKSTPEPARRLRELWLPGYFAMLSGDFGFAARAAQEAERIGAELPNGRDDYLFHYFLVRTGVAARLEMGDVAGARQAAHDFILRSEGWSEPGMDAAPFVNGSRWLDRLTAAPGMAGMAEFERRRDAWVEERLNVIGEYPGVVWAMAYAMPALTPEDAERAIDALPRFGALTGFGWPHSQPAAVGHVYLLAGKMDEAIPYLRTAVASCSFYRDPYGLMHAAFDLGQALESKGDRAGACDAFAGVLARWGNAKPRSVTADQARARRRALGCAR